MSHLELRNGDVVLVLTHAEARGLCVLAGEGAAGMLTDKEAARIYIGPPALVKAAASGFAKLQAASVQKKRGTA